MEPEKDMEWFRNRLKIILHVLEEIKKNKRDKSKGPCIMLFLIHRYAPVILIPKIDCNENGTIDAYILIDRINRENKKKYVRFENLEIIKTLYSYEKVFLEWS